MYFLQNIIFFLVFNGETLTIETDKGRFIITPNLSERYQGVYVDFLSKEHYGKIEQI